MSETTLQAVEVPEKSYTLRMLGAKDIAPMTSILSKIGFKQLKDCFDAEKLKAFTDEADVESAGMEVAFEIGGVILTNYAKCQDEIFAFLADLSGMDKEDVASLPLDTFAEMLIDVFKKKEFASFFSVVSKLFK